jgi:hypothetical protein
MNSISYLPDASIQAHDEFLPSINSYLGHFIHADSYRLRENLCKTISQHDLGRHIAVAPNFGSLKNLQATRQRRAVARRSLLDDALMT